MPVTIDQPAPYAPASAILDLIERHRSRGLPAVVDTDVLLRAGVSDSLVPRTLQALRSLDLLTEDGKPSETFEGIRLAPSAEYQKRLVDWLSATYSDALSFIDPATDDEVAIRDAFRKYVPTGQQSRMVSLFIGLFTAAGIVPTRQKQQASRKQSSSNFQNKNAGPKVEKSAVSASSKNEFQDTLNSALPPALAGLLATLPPQGGNWTQNRRDQFLNTFGVVMDYCFTVGEAISPGENTATDQ